MTEKIEIKGQIIRLGQFLKISMLAATGGEAKNLIQSGEVKVNGDIETRRGRQLKHLDKVETGGRNAQVFYLKPSLR